MADIDQTEPIEGEEEAEALEESRDPRPTICGIKQADLDSFRTALDTRQMRTEFQQMLHTLRHFQYSCNYREKRIKWLESKMLDEGNDLKAEALTEEFARIDAEEKDPAAAYRRKLRAAVTTIDPLLLRQSIVAGLKKGDPFARKLYSDIWGMTTEAKAQATDDRPPGITFNYGLHDTEEDEDAKNPQGVESNPDPETILQVAPKRLRLTKEV